MLKASPNLTFLDFHPKLSNFRDDVLQGLQKKPKQISPKYFYDKRGSEIYDQICDTQEYYPTRTEIRILKDNMPEIRRLIGQSATLIEMGCGSSRKIRLLLENLDHLKNYVPLDISRDYLLEMAQQLADDFPDVDIMAVCADYTQGLDLSAHWKDPHSKRVAFFPGSTVGNLEPPGQELVLKVVADVVGKGGGLLVGVDVKKDTTLLHKAYNDAQGVTAQFNQNLLVRINEELEGKIPLEKFAHKAFYNPDHGRMEMHLVSQVDQTVAVNGAQFSFKKGESIHTECSYKFTIEEFQNLAKKIGFKPVQAWTDPNNLFSVHYLTLG